MAATRTKEVQEDPGLIQSRREALLDQSAMAMTKAKISLLIDSDARGAFFTHLTLRLRTYPAFGVGTACTDGESLLYEPEFILSLKPRQVSGLLVHEVMHCAMLHHLRRGERDPFLANVAADLSINDCLTEAGYELPSTVCMVGEGIFKDFPKGLCFEEYYDLLQKHSKKVKQQFGDGSGDGKGDKDPGGCGYTKEPQDQAKKAEQEAEWNVAVQAAAEAAKQRGNVPAAIQRIIGQVEEAKIDWRAELRDFLTKFHPERNDWNRPNRRMLNYGLYLPTLSGERLGHIAVAIDTSGSIGERELNEFAGEIMGIIGTSPSKLSVVWCDCKIDRVDVYEDISKEDLDLKTCGGGGTSHVPVFNWLKEQVEDPPECIVCLTDLMTEFPDEHPDLPVLWVSNHRGSEAPFGKTVWLR